MRVGEEGPFERLWGIQKSPESPEVEVRFREKSCEVCDPVTQRDPSFVECTCKDTYYF